MEDSAEEQRRSKVQAGKATLAHFRQRKTKGESSQTSKKKKARKGALVHANDFSPAESSLAAAQNAAEESLPVGGNTQAEVSMESSSLDVPDLQQNLSELDVQLNMRQATVTRHADKIPGANDDQELASQTLQQSALHDDVTARLSSSLQETLQSREQMEEEFTLLSNKILAIDLQLQDVSDVLRNKSPGETELLNIQQKISVIQQNFKEHATHMTQLDKRARDLEKELEMSRKPTNDEGNRMAKLEDLIQEQEKKLSILQEKLQASESSLSALQQKHSYNEQEIIVFHHNVSVGMQTEPLSPHDGYISEYRDPVSCNIGVDRLESLTAMIGDLKEKLMESEALRESLHKKLEEQMLQFESERWSWEQKHADTVKKLTLQLEHAEEQAKETAAQNKQEKEHLNEELRDLKEKLKLETESSQALEMQHNKELQSYMVKLQNLEEERDKIHQEISSATENTSSNLFITQSEVNILQKDFKIDNFRHELEDLKKSFNRVKARKEHENCKVAQLHEEEDSEELLNFPDANSTMDRYLVPSCRTEFEQSDNQQDSSRFELDSDFILEQSMDSAVEGNINILCSPMPITNVLAGGASVGNLLDPESFAVYLSNNLSPDGHSELSNMSDESLFERCTVLMEKLQQKEQELQRCSDTLEEALGKWREVSKELSIAQDELEREKAINKGDCKGCQEVIKELKMERDMLRHKLLDHEQNIKDSYEQKLYLEDLGHERDLLKLCLSDKEKSLSQLLGDNKGLQEKLSETDHSLKMALELKDKLELSNSQLTERLEQSEKDREADQQKFDNKLNYKGVEQQLLHKAVEEKEAEFLRKEKTLYDELSALKEVKAELESRLQNEVVRLNEGFRKSMVLSEDKWKEQMDLLKQEHEKELRFLHDRHKEELLGVRANLNIEQQQQMEELQQRLEASHMSHIQETMQQTKAAHHLEFEALRLSLTNMHAAHLEMSQANLHKEKDNALVQLREALNEKWEQEVAIIQSRLQFEMQHLEKQHSQEMECVREDHVQKLEQLREDQSREKLQIQEEHTRVIAQMQDDHAREMLGLQEQHSNQMEALRECHIQEKENWVKKQEQRCQDDFDLHSVLDAEHKNQLREQEEAHNIENCREEEEQVILLQIEKLKDQSSQEYKLLQAQLDDRRASRRELNDLKEQLLARSAQVGEMERLKKDFEQQKLQLKIDHEREMEELRIYFEEKSRATEENYREESEILHQRLQQMNEEEEKEELTMLNSSALDIDLESDNEQGDLLQQLTHQLEQHKEELVYLRLQSEEKHRHEIETLHAALTLQYKEDVLNMKMDLSERYLTEMEALKRKHSMELEQLRAKLSEEHIREMKFHLQRAQEASYKVDTEAEEKIQTLEHLPNRRHQDVLSLVASKDQCCQTELQHNLYAPEASSGQLETEEQIKELVKVTLLPKAECDTNNQNRFELQHNDIPQSLLRGLQKENIPDVYEEEVINTVSDLNKQLSIRVFNFKQQHKKELTSLVSELQYQHEEHPISLTVHQHQLEEELNAQLSDSQKLHKEELPPLQEEELGARVAELQRLHEEELGARVAELQGLHEEELGARVAELHRLHEEELGARVAELQRLHEEELGARVAELQGLHEEELGARVAELQRLHEEELGARVAELQRLHESQVQHLEMTHLSKLDTLESSYLIEIQKIRDEHAHAVAELEICFSECLQEKDKEILGKITQAEAQWHEQHKQKLELAQDLLKKELAAIHLEKFQAMSQELEAAHMEDMNEKLSRLRSQLEEEKRQALDALREEVLQMEQQNKLALEELQDLHRAEVQQKTLEQSQKMHDEVTTLKEHLQKQEILISELDCQCRALSAELKNRCDHELQLQEEIELLKCQTPVLVEQQVTQLKGEFDASKHCAQQEREQMTTAHQAEVECLKGQLEERGQLVLELQEQVSSLTKEVEAFKSQLELLVQRRERENQEADNLVAMLQSDAHNSQQELKKLQDSCQRLLKLFTDVLKSTLSTEDLICKNIDKSLAQRDVEDSMDSKPWSVSMHLKDDDKHRVSPDCDTLTEHSLMSSDEGCELSEYLCDSVLGGLDAGLENEDKVLQISQRLRLAVERLLEMVTGSAVQIEQTREMQTRLQEEFSSRSEDMAQVVSQNQDLLKRLVHEAEAKNLLQVELHKAQGLIEGFAAEKASLKEALSAKESAEHHLILELEKSREQLKILTKEPTVSDDQKEILVRLQEILSGNSKDVEVELLKETERLASEKLELACQAKKDRSNLLSQMKVLEMELEEQMSCNQELLKETKEMSDLKQQIQSLEKQLKNQRQFMDEQAVEREHERDEFQQEIQNLEEQLKHASKNQGDLKGYGFLDWSIQVESLEAQVKEKAENCNLLLKGKDDLEQQIAESNEEIDRMLLRIQDLEQAALSNADAAKKCSQLEAELQRMQKVQKELQQDKEALQQQQYNSVLQISALQSKLDETRHRVPTEGDPDSAIREELQAEREALHRKEKEADNLAEQLEQFRGELVNKTEEALQLNMQLEIQRKQADLALQQAQAEYLNLKNEVYSLRQKVDQNRASSSMLLPQALMQEKNQEIDHLNDQLLRLQREHTAADSHHAELEDLKSLVEHLRSDQQRLRKDKEEEVERLHEVIEKLQQELEQLGPNRHEVSDSQESLDQLELGVVENLHNELRKGVQHPRQTSGFGLEQARKLSQELRQVEGQEDLRDLELDTLRQQLEEKEVLHNAEVEVLEENLHNLQETNRQQSQELVSLQMQCTTFQEESELLKSLLAERDDELAALSSRVQEMQDSLRKQTASLIEKDLLVQTLQEQRAAYMLGIENHLLQRGIHLEEAWAELQDLQESNAAHQDVGKREKFKEEILKRQNVNMAELQHHLQNYGALGHRFKEASIYNMSEQQESHEHQRNNTNDLKTIKTGSFTESLTDMSAWDSPEMVRKQEEAMNSLRAFTPLSLLSIECSNEPNFVSSKSSGHVSRLDPPHDRVFSTPSVAGSTYSIPPSNDRSSPCQFVPLIQKIMIVGRQRQSNETATCDRISSCDILCFIPYQVDSTEHATIDYDSSEDPRTAKDREMVYERSELCDNSDFSDHFNPEMMTTEQLLHKIQDVNSVGQKGLIGYLQNMVKVVHKESCEILALSEHPVVQVSAPHDFLSEKVEHLLASDRSNLLSEVKDLRSELQRAHSQNQEKLQQLQETLAKTEERGKTVEHQLRREAELLEYKLQQECTVSADLKASLAHERDRAAEQLGVLTLAQGTVSQLREEQERMMLEQEKLVQSQKELQMEISRLSEELERREQAIQALKVQHELENKLMEEEKAFAQQRQALNEKCIQELSSSLEEQRTLTNKLSADLSQEHSCSNNLRKELQIEQSRFEALLSQERSMLSQSQQEVEKLKQNLQSLSDTLTLERNMKEQLKIQHVQEVSRKGQEWQKEHSLVLQLQSRLEEVSSQARELASTMEKIQKQANSSKHQLESEIQVVRKETVREQEEGLKLRAIIESLQSEKQQLNSSLVLHREHEGSLQSERDRSKAQLLILQAEQQNWIKPSENERQTDQDAKTNKERGDGREKWLREISMSLEVQQALINKLSADISREPSCNYNLIKELQIEQSRFEVLLSLECGKLSHAQQEVEKLRQDLQSLSDTLTLERNMREQLKMNHAQEWSKKDQERQQEHSLVLQSRSRIEELSSQARELASMLEKAQRQSNSTKRLHESEVQSVREETKKAQEEALRLRALVESLQSEKQQLNSFLEVHRERVSGLQKECDRCQAEILFLQSEQRNWIKEREREKKRDQEAKTNKEKIDERERRIYDLQRQHEQDMSRIKELQNMLADLEDQERALTSRRSRLWAETRSPRKIPGGSLSVAHRQDKVWQQHLFQAVHQVKNWVENKSSPPAKEDVLSLLATLSELKSELQQENSPLHSTDAVNSVLDAERAAWQCEKRLLQAALARAESELSKKASENKPTMDLSDSKIQRLYRKYLRAESFRKALIYQKKYLLLLLGGFQACEKATLSLIARMGVYPSPADVQVPAVSRPGLTRFRSAVRVVIAISRLKYLVEKWHKITRKGSSGETGAQSSALLQQVALSRTDALQQLGSKVLNSPPTRDGPSFRSSPVPVGILSPKQKNSWTPTRLTYSPGIPSERLHCNSQNPEHSITKYIKHLEMVQKRLGGL
ncbi:pericentrin [Spea bombifrons]|uniref:pericentrin n=1 Tax=Spea bombifrons TaxID=233779 RepID=UPI00234A0AA2|nr:pericentrin [Spea bombifrons]